MNVAPSGSSPTADGAAAQAHSARGFRAAFASICAFLGRPSSETSLFSGVPENELVDADADTIERLARRVGLTARAGEVAALSAGDMELPALAILPGGRALAFVETDGDGRLVCGNLRDKEGKLLTVERSRLPALKIVALYSFAVAYLNASDQATVGEAARIEQPHWLWSTLVPYWRTYLRILMAALFINMIAVASPLFTMNVYDRVLPNQAMSTLWVLAIGITTAYVFDLALKAARAALIDYTGRKADLRLSYLLFDKVLHSTLATRPMSTGEYASRITQYEFVREFFTSNTIAVLIDTAFSVIFLVVIYIIAGWLAVIPTLAIGVSVIIGLVAQSRIARRMAAAANEAAQRQALLIETIATMETVKSVRAEAHFLRRWHELSKNASHTSEQIKEASATAAHATQFVQQIVTVLIVLGGAYSFADGKITTGAIVASVMLAGRAVSPLGQIALTLARLRQAILSLRILDGIMAQEEDRPATVGFVNRTVGSAQVAFQSVGFNYPSSDYPALNGLSFSIAPGERVGIVGRIGSGKTTIGRLIGGLYPAGSGRILLDGVDLRQYHPAEVRKAVAVAGQAAELFAGTVKENLLIGRPDATDDELLDVARRTGVDAFVARHPRGFDMPVGERGSQLSGGQKQALTIARLLLSRPKVVFLDEPSGAMDMASERALIDNLRKSFAADVSVIISTHRFSMLELVDRLIVIDQGKVVADGPKRQVIEALQRSAGGETT